MPKGSFHLAMDILPNSTDRSVDDHCHRQIYHKGYLGQGLPFLMRVISPRRVMLVAVLGLVLLCMVACQQDERLAARGCDDWSRGVFVGQATVNEPLGLASDPENQRLLIAWVAAGENGTQSLRLASLDEAGRIAFERELQTNALRPEEVAIVPAADGLFHLFCVDRAEGEGVLWHALLDPEGTAGSWQCISEEAVISYATAADGRGGAHVILSVEREGQPVLLALHLDSSGTQKGPYDLGLGGFDPTACLDENGTLHLAFVSEPDYGRREIHYATYDAATSLISEDQVLASLAVPTGLVLRPPSLGLTPRWAYVIWAVERRGGGNAPPSAESFVVTVPRSEPGTPSAARQVIVPPLRKPDYTNIETALAIREMAPVPEGSPVSDFVYWGSAGEARGEDLPVAFAVQLTGRTKSTVQIVLTLWREGQMVGYQVVTDTPSISIRPNLLTSGDGNLTLAWLDTAGFGSFDIYVASTHPSMRAYLNRTRPQDVAAAILNVLWGVVQALAFTPMVIIWLVPPLIFLAIYVLVQPEGDLERRGPRVALVVASLLYVIGKYLLRPGWLLALPVPTWVPGPLANILTLLAPLLLTVVAAAITLLYTRRREYPSLFPAFLLFAGSDALLTLLIYVPAVLSE